MYVVPVGVCCIEEAQLQNEWMNETVCLRMPLAHVLYGGDLQCTTCMYMYIHVHVYIMTLDLMYSVRGARYLHLFCSFDDICCLSNCDTLSELTLDGNPLANLPDHRHSIIFHVSHLRTLDQTTVSVSLCCVHVCVCVWERERERERERMATLVHWYIQCTRRIRYSTYMYMYIISNHACRKRSDLRH